MQTGFISGYGDVKLAFDQAGDALAPPVLLIHGADQNKGIWDALSEGLTDAGRRVIRLDLRGHGESERPADGRYDFDAYVGDLRAVLSHLDDRPVVIAASLGAWIANACLGEGGQHLATGLVIIDAVLDLGPGKTRVSASVRSDVGDRRADFRPPALSPEELGLIRRRLLNASRNLTVPVLIIRGRDAPPWNAAFAETLGDTMATAEVVELDASGSDITTQRVDDLNAVLLDFLERKVPRRPADYIAGSDVRTLRNALGCFATGVTIVTVLDTDGRPVGLTANSFTSVSLDPPLLLVCVATTSSSAATLRSAETFAVNVLHTGQQPASTRFARRDENRFAATSWKAWESGAPIIQHSLASFECERHAVHDGGDHMILVGRVRRARYEPQRDPLLFFRGKYRRLHFS